ncbi:MAG: NnrS family protein [Bradyrhizobium sp.]|nr:NnrS family protein [Bradyrhizobium sp.]
MVLILHVGYLFVPTGFGLGALAAFGIVPISAAVHAWMVGAAGSMTLAVMTRATLGHTGQSLTASWATQTIYLAIVVAAARVYAVLDPAHDFILLHIAACGWVLAFHAIAFGPRCSAANGRRLQCGNDATSSLAIESSLARCKAAIGSNAKQIYFFAMLWFARATCAFRRGLRNVLIRFGFEHDLDPSMPNFPIASHRCHFGGA